MPQNADRGANVDKHTAWLEALPEAMRDSAAGEALHASGPGSGGDRDVTAATWVRLETTSTIDEPLPSHR
jgi:hypothetical protein